ncbi:MAG: pyruvate kinase [Clostridia bacterium]
MRKTKIICTLGPASDKPEIIKALIQAGMDAARFNFSHGDQESKLATYKTFVAVRNELKKPIPAILDTRGPEIRLGDFKDEKITLNDGDHFTLTTRELLGDQTIAQVTYKRLNQDLKPGARVLVDDGQVGLEVDSIDGTEIHCTVVWGGNLSNHKGINLPGTRFSMPYVSKQDYDDILFGIRTGFDVIAASFVRSKEDVLEIRKILNENGGKHMLIMSKIENAEGVANLEEIIGVSDALMVARGDMGVEIPLEDIPVMQKRIIRLGYQAGLPVVTATQMLDSMIAHPRPTRAETTDVANAIYDGTSCIMLSGETANGKYPIEAVRIMSTIAERAEKDIDYRKRFFGRSQSEHAHDITDAISLAACLTAYSLKARAIIAVTKYGQTARMISRFRSDIPVIGCTPDGCTLRQLSISWGVIPLEVGEEHVTDVLIDHAVDAARQAGLVKSGDLVVLTAGVPLGRSGTTNLIKVYAVE